MRATTFLSGRTHSYVEAMTLLRLYMGSNQIHRTYFWSPLTSHSSTSQLAVRPPPSGIPFTSNSRIRAPCVAWYSPPDVSVASDRKLATTVFPLYNEKQYNTMYFTVIIDDPWGEHSSCMCNLPYHTVIKADKQYLQSICKYCYLLLTNLFDLS